MSLTCKMFLMVAAVAFTAPAFAEPQSCLSPDIKKRIRKKVNDISPFAGCQNAYQAATQTCAQLARGGSLDTGGTLAHVKGLQERRLRSCEKRVVAAKEACASDRVVLSVLKAEFNDVIRCGDNAIAALNGRMMKEAEYARKPASDEYGGDDYDSDSAVTDGEIQPEQEPAVAAGDY